MSGSNAAMRNDPRAQEFLRREYQRLHQQDMFMPDPRYTKQEAHQIAFQRMLAAKQQGRI